MTARESLKITTAAVLIGTAAGLAAAQDKAATKTDEPQFEGYDFAQVVETMESSVNPLQREMDRTFQVFVTGVEEAEELLDEGKTQEAVQKAAVAIDTVLAVRDEVLNPMWEGQVALAEQVAQVRARLAQAVEAAAESGPVQLDDQTEATLDAIARRIAQEDDPLRKKRLVAHYRTVRNLARIKAMSVELSPDQRKMWLSVLQVLDEAAVAHQQVMMGTEVLFAQFEATAANLRAYVSLMETVDGASQLMRVVRGVDDHSAGMASFADSMNELQQRLAGFNESVEHALQGRMLELEAQIDAIEPLSSDGASPVMIGEEDGELAARIARIGGGTK
jgi:flagellar hook-basal body complex protein FliE